MDFLPPETTAWEPVSSCPSSKQSNILWLHGHASCTSKSLWIGFILVIPLNVSDFETIMGSPLNALWGNKTPEEQGSFQLNK